MKSYDALFWAWVGRRAATLVVSSVLLMNVPYCFLQYWKKEYVLSGVWRLSLVLEFLCFCLCRSHAGNFVERQKCLQWCRTVCCVKQQLQKVGFMVKWICAQFEVSHGKFSENTIDFKCLTVGNDGLKEVTVQVGTLLHTRLDGSKYRIHQFEVLKHTLAKGETGWRVRRQRQTCNVFFWIILTFFSCVFPL